MPTIRIDDEVYSWLKKQAEPFEDTPNSVLRRIANLDAPRNAQQEDNNMGFVVTGPKGRQLNVIWKVYAKHALFHKDGTWYEHLEKFPGALFDKNGYILFKTEQEYRQCSYLNFGETVNVHRGISSIPGYKRVKQEN